MLPIEQTLENTDKSIFGKVLLAGPSTKARGGIAAVLRNYTNAARDFGYIATTCRLRKSASIAQFVLAVAVLPILRLRGYRILHAHSSVRGSFRRKTILVRWARFWGMHTILHLHSGAIREYFGKTGINKAQKQLQACDAVVALTQGWKKYLDSELSLSNVYVIGNPVTSVPNIPLSRNGSTLRLLFLGAILEAKGIFDLLDVIYTHKKEFSGRITLDIGGIGKEYDRMFRQIDTRGLHEIVRLHGWVEGKAKEQLLRECDVLILPSYSEGMPVSILEAMTARMAVITCPVGGIPEIASDGVNAIFTPPGNKNALYKAIKKLLENPQQLQAMADRNYDKAKTYSMEATLEKLRQLYNNIII